MAFTILGRNERRDLFPHFFQLAFPAPAVQACDCAHLAFEKWEQIRPLRARTGHESGMTGKLDFESLVTLYYPPLYRFALSLTRNESDACDLTQQTFYVWAAKGHQLQDASKVKTWLFTTLHRLFLEMQRRHHRFPHHELDEVSSELPNIDAEIVNQVDSMVVVEMLGKVDAPYQAPVALFYLEDYSYKEIADILSVPMGTVKSRISRGIAQLQNILARHVSVGNSGRKGAT